MSMKIIYGRTGSGKTSYIFEQISKNINNGRKKYIITPEQFSFSAEKELLNSIAKNQGSNAVINAEVLTFARMAHRVASEVGGSNKTNLSNCGKAMLVYSLLSDKKNNLKFLGKNSNNIDMCLTQITELKKHGVTVDTLQNLKENISDKYLESKLDDIYTIYSKFQEKINSNYIDENDALSVLYEQIDKTEEFNNTEIYIDEFVGFTKQEYMIIEKLLEKSAIVTINITTDSLEFDKNAVNDIFYSNKETASKLYKLAKSLNVKIEQPLHLENDLKHKNEELKHIEKNLYSYPYKKYTDKLENINLFFANNQYSEIEEVAKQIVKLVKNEGYRYKEIAVITKNIDTYSNLCKAIFNKYDIPVYIDEKRDLSQNILVKYLIAILDVFSKNWSYDSVINYAKSGFCQIENEDIYELENYSLKWEVKGNKWYKEDWNFKDSEEVGTEKINKLNEIRRKITQPLVTLKENLSGNKTAKQISKELYQFLIANNIDKILEEKIEKLNDEGKVNLSAEYETSWKIIMQVLDEIVLVFGDEKISFENYMQILKTGLRESKLGTIPMAQDQVTVGDVDRSRSHKIKTAFIIGLNDGMFPSVNKAEGFLNDNDRNLIKENGIELAKGTIERIYEDNFNIYKAFTTAENKLFLSYSSSDMNSKSLRPSILIARIKKIFPSIAEQSDIVNRKSELITEENIFEGLLVNLRDFRDGKEIDKIWFSVYNLYSEDENWKDKLQEAIKALNYVSKSEWLKKDNIDKLYGEKLRTSVSKLESYANCPFSYYLKYGLKLNDKEVLKVESVDTGTFMHDVIDTFFGIIEEKRIDIKKIANEEIEKILNDIVEEKLNLNRNYIFKYTAKYRVLINRLKRVISLSIKYIIQTIKQSDFEVFGHEVEFGGKGQYQPITIKTDSGKTVEIVGKIDRVDILKQPDGTYVRVIDYKSSIHNIDLNKVVAGLQLQLITYLNETCKVEDFAPAGVLYFSLLDKKYSSDKMLTEDEIKEKIRQDFKMKGLILADVNIIKKMDTNIENEPKGISRIIPAGITKDGELNKQSSSSAVTKEQFEYLQKYTNKVIKQISENLLSGNIEIRPAYNSKTKSTPCEYCKYRAICRFDNQNPKSSYRFINNLNKEAVLDMIKEREE